MDPEYYTPTEQEKAYASGRNLMHVYHEGYVREVCVHTWRLVATPGPSRRVRWLTQARGRNAGKKALASNNYPSCRYGDCERCGKNTLMTRHHIVHKSKGGGGGNNLQDLCWPCHCYAHQVLKVPSGVRVPALEHAGLAQR